MNYASINKVDIANGEGIRVSLFVSGCKHHCQGCFNKEAWDFEFGKQFSDETTAEIINALSHEYISGLTLLGGEPFDPNNIQYTTDLCRMVKSQYPQKTIWAYTGYCYDDIYQTEIMDYIDILVDGPFMYDQKDLTLIFRGSKNQRIIDVKKSMATKNVVLYME